MERLGDNPPKFVATLIEVCRHKLVDIEKLINDIFNRIFDINLNSTNKELFGKSLFGDVF